MPIFSDSSLPVSSIQQVTSPEIVSVTYVDMFREWLIKIGIPESLAYFTEIMILLGVVAILSIIGNYIAKRIILTIVKTIVKKSKTDWDDILLDHKVFDRLSHFAPALIIYFSSAYILYEFPGWIKFIQRCTYIYMIAVTLFVINAFINGIHDIYKTLPVAKNRSIKGYIQVVKIIIYLVGAIIIISTLMGKSPFFLLSGLGAFTAILMLIFQDSIKGLVGGIQLSANDMVRLGDWITVPKYNLDGTVIEINLNTLKIQNADMSVSTVPTYTLVNESFQNWRTMTEGEGRRIKRSVSIDMRSVGFCNQEQLSNMSKIKLITEFVEQQKQLSEEQNKTMGIPANDNLNGKRLTNIGIFRHYLEVFVKNNQNINPEMTFVIRYLEPGPSGMPVEIWAFSKHKDLPHFESVQAEIFEHVISIIPEFGLRIFQNPSGEDFRVK